MTRIAYPLVLVASFVLLSLVPAPTAAAGSCLTSKPALVCQGQEWCDDSGCATPQCVTPTGPCVLNAPGSGPSNCLITPTNTLGLVCEGQRWCTNDGLCGTPICVTNTSRVCILESP